MNEHTTSRSSDALESLRQQIALLEARRDALTGLSEASEQMRSRLSSDLAVDIESILDAREQHCRRLGTLTSGTGKNVDAADTSNEARALARTAASLQSESVSLAESILACQRECEAMLKERLDTAADALRESQKRRRLDAAYGPAHKHSTPVFLDKQQ